MQNFDDLSSEAAAGKAFSDQPLTILGIETSCDETAASVVRLSPQGGAEVLSSIIHSQIDDHQAYGGVVPEIAARSHVEMIEGVAARAMSEAGLGYGDLDGVGATAGPGLVGGVMVGLGFGKAVALARGLPFLAVNHLEGHAVSARLGARVDYPFLLLLVSGGHCQLLRVNGVGDYDRLATTIDDAVGEAFDKSAKILGLGFPGGPAVEQAAKCGDAKAVPLPRPLKGADEPHFSFAGLKSAVLRAHDSGQYRAEDIAASFQQAVTECLEDRLEYSLSRIEPTRALVVAGGVAANEAVRAMLQRLADRHGMRFVAPPHWLCTDNGAMIAWAGAERFAAGLTDPLDVLARPRWPLDPKAEAVRGAGVRA